jgi:hypothetical protein
MQLRQQRQLEEAQRQAEKTQGEIFDLEFEISNQTDEIMPQNNLSITGNIPKPSKQGSSTTINTFGYLDDEDDEDDESVYGTGQGKGRKNKGKRR